MILKKQNQLSFLILPFVVFVIFPNIQDANGIPKLIALILGTVILIFLNFKYFKINQFIQLLPWLITFSYILIQILKRNNINEFILGSYMRNGGIIALLSFSIIFTIISNIELTRSNQFIKLFKITYFGLLLYAVLDIFKLLPFTQVNSYENSVSLTLTNPNFASSYIGICISVLPLMLSNSKTIKYLEIISIFFGLYVLQSTNSIQGFLIIILSLFMYLLFFRHQLQSIFKINIRLLSIGLGLMTIIVLAFGSSIMNWLIVNGSVRQRINYWELALNIFRDNFIFGVGLENLSNKITLYRSLEFIKQEGVFTIMDRSHNVFLDHYVNGGIITGSLWLIFVMMVTFKSFQILVGENQPNLRSINYVFVIMWFGYIVQAFISVDHLALTLLGFISAAFIVSIHSTRKSKLNRTLNLNNNASKIIIVSTYSFFLVYTILFARTERWVYSVVQQNNYEYISKIYKTDFIAPRSLEKVTVKLSNDKQYEAASKFGDKLLQLNPNSHQAYFTKAIYSEFTGDLPRAKLWMFKALEIDKHNSVYLLSLALYESKSGNRNSASSYLDKAIESNPDQQGIEFVRKQIRDM
jgi:tetratricopeptide (TPR) repeat protein